MPERKGELGAAVTATGLVRQRRRVTVIYIVTRRRAGPDISVYLDRERVIPRPEGPTRREKGGHSRRMVSDQFKNRPAGFGKPSFGCAGGGSCAETPNTMLIGREVAA